MIYTTVFNTVVQIHQMRICITYYMTSFDRRIKAHDTCTKKGFYPVGMFNINARLKNYLIYPRYKFCLNALRFNRRNNYRHGIII